MVAQGRIHSLRGNERFVHVLGHHFRRGMAVEGGAPREQVVECRAERVNVGTRIHALGILRLLGGNIVGRSDHRA